MRIAIIIGSIREGRFGPTAADWLAARACRRPDLDVDIIDLAQAWLPTTLPAEPPTTGGPPAVEDLRPWLATADGFVIVTSEDNHSFPASLKNAIDWYREEWRAKPVAFVAYGAESGGLRAVDHLRPVFTSLAAACVGDPVAFRFRNAPDDSAAERLLDDLKDHHHAHR
ncbi:NAD(P)H-dependent oxidoreductase [Streptomyces sp. MZ04]|uniref:NADPH-dependent FMN reductase n=1 Tax=Streptomyces sp. MZ04 TaxID=2559236 RepID=UPI00107EAE91|nr:NAD(P)H-dependent oxidoreductase [Streptomyces sp. MZ04]TGA95279.1 NADPH-dependent oxidoreductase [Streptomyces sp. MZ04]